MRAIACGGGNEDTVRGRRRLEPLTVECAHSDDASLAGLRVGLAIGGGCKCPAQVQPLPPRAGDQSLHSPPRVSPIEPVELPCGDPCHDCSAFIGFTGVAPAARVRPE